MRYYFRRLYNLFRMFILRHKSKNTHIGKNQQISVGSEMHFSKTAEVHIGDNICMDGFCRIIASDGATLTLGDNCYANMGTMFSANKKIIIGNHCFFGPHATVVDNDHKFEQNKGISCNQYSNGEIVIGNECWFGANVTILRDTHIGDGCIVGAGCVIKGDIPANSLITNKQDLHINQIEDRKNG